MKVVLERLEFTWWHFHIRVLDESEFMQELLPTLHQLWEERDQSALTLAWAVLGFPLGMIVGYLANLVS